MRSIWSKLNNIFLTISRFVFLIKLNVTLINRGSFTHNWLKIIKYLITVVRSRILCISKLCLSCENNLPSDRRKSNEDDCDTVSTIRCLVPLAMELLTSQTFPLLANNRASLIQSATTYGLLFRRRHVVAQLCRRFISVIAFSINFRFD